jgi:hypothetical protein
MGFFMKGIDLGKVVKLPSSQEVLYHANGEGEEEALLSLLKEASDRGLKNGQRILICYEDTGDYDPDKGEEPFVVDKFESISLEELKEKYKEWFGKDYSNFWELRRQIEKRNNALYLEDCRSCARKAIYSTIVALEEGRIF